MKPQGQLATVDAAANFPATTSAADALSTLQTLYAECVTHAVSLAREANRRLPNIEKASHRDLMRGIKTALDALPQVERLIASMQGRSEMGLLDKIDEVQALLVQSKDELQRRAAIDVTPKDEDDDEVEADTQAEASARESQG